MNELNHFQEASYTNPEGFVTQKVSETSENMRLDKFLKVSRLIKRRTVANEVSDMGRVLVNGTPAKPAKQLKVGDIITIEYANKKLEVKVVKIPANNVSVQEAASLYEIRE